MHTRRFIAALILGVPSAAWSACIHNNLPVQCPTNPATMQPIPDGSQSFFQDMTSTCWRFPMNSGSACTPGINFPPAQPSSPAAGSPPPPPVVPPSPPTVVMPTVSMPAFPRSAREIVALRDPNMTRQLIEQGLARERIEQALSREKPTEKSQTAIEYGMPAALMAVVIIGQLQAQVDSLLKPKEQPNATAVASSDHSTKTSEQTAIAPPAKSDEIDMLLAGLPDDIMSESEEGERERWRQMERARDYGHQGMSDEYHRSLAEYQREQQRKMREFEHQENERARTEGRPEPYPERNAPSAASFAREQEPGAGSVAQWTGAQSPRRVFMPTSEVFIATAGTEAAQTSGDKITLVIPADWKEPFLGPMVATPDTLRFEIRLDAQSPASQSDVEAPEVLGSLTQAASFEETAAALVRDLGSTDPAKEQRAKNALAFVKPEVKQEVDNLLAARKIIDGLTGDSSAYLSAKEEFARAGPEVKDIVNRYVDTSSAPYVLNGVPLPWAPQSQATTVGAPSAAPQRVAPFQPAVVTPSPGQLQREAAGQIIRDLSGSDPARNKRGKEALDFASPEVKALVGQHFSRIALSAMQAATDAVNAGISGTSGRSSKLAAGITR